jgi:hydrogenase maturation protease
LRQELDSDPLEKGLTGDSSAIERRSSIVVIGCGNPLRSDDGIGCHIARELRNRWNTPAIEVIECREFAPEMADTIRAATMVIFVDAAIGGVPGEVRHHRLDGSSAQGSSTAFSHARTPDGLIALAAELYGVAPEAHLFTVCGSSFCYGESISREVTDVLPSLVAEIENLLGAAESQMPLGDPTSAR